MPPRAISLALLAIAGLLAAAPAAGAVAFLPPERVSEGDENVSVPEVAVDAAGNVLAVWQYGDPGPPAQAIQAKYRPAGGVFGPLMTVSDTAAPYGDLNTSEPQVAMNDAGAAAVVWRRSDESEQFCCNDVDARFRSADGTWSAVQHDLSPNTDAYVPGVAVDAEGNAVAWWFRDDDPSANYRFVMQAAYRPAGGQFGPAADVSPDDQETFSEGEAAFDGAGNMVAVYGDFSGALGVQVRRRPKGSDLWGAVANVLDGGFDQRDAQVAVHPDGTADVGWFDADVDNGDRQIRLRRVPPTGGALGDVQTLSVAGPRSPTWTCSSTRRAPLPPSGWRTTATATPPSAEVPRRRISRRWEPRRSWARRSSSTSPIWRPTGRGTCWPPGRSEAR